MIFEGQYESNSFSISSLNRKTKETQHSTEENNDLIKKIEIKQRDENKSFFETRFEVPQGFAPTATTHPAGTPGLFLGILYKEGNLIKADTVGSDKDNGSGCYSNFILDENRVVKSFVYHYKESGTQQPGPDHVQWPVILSAEFKRIE